MPAQSLASNTSVSNGTRQKKRTRTSEAVEGIVTAAHSEKYWFEDGTLILNVEDTLFRVHRGVLSRHSNAFDDAFPFLQRGNSEPENTIAGCNIADLRGDKVEDWERVLAVIYDLDVAYRTKEKLSIDILVSMLRLGRKYRFDGIFNQAFQRVRELIPTTLEKWTGFPGEYCGHNLLPLFNLIKILLLIGNQTLLPSLFYCCSAHAKGTASIFSASKQAELSEIDPYLEERLAIGREKILAACLELHFTWVFKRPADSLPEPGSVNQRACKCQSLKQEYLRRFLLDAKPHIALRPVSEVLQDIPRTSICKTCRDGIIAEHNASRQAIWNKLPSFFGLPAWTDLKDA